MEGIIVPQWAHIIYERSDCNAQKRRLAADGQPRNYLQYVGAVFLGLLTLKRRAATAVVISG
jgi:hypothetical protein